MATQSTAMPPVIAEDKPQNPASELVQAAVDDKQDANAAATKESITPSVFVNSEPMREEQVQNAVKFLSHPKVRGSPVMYRRSFLEKKGLTKEEIDESFRRVPDTSPTATSVQATSTSQGSSINGQLKPSSNIQAQTPTQSLQPAAPAGGISKAGFLTLYRFHWSHAFLAVGLLAVSGAGTALLIKKTIVPRLKSWIRKVVSEEEDDAEKTSSKPSLAEETAAAAKAAAAAAVDAAKASQEMMKSKNAERRYFEEFMKLLDVQVQEMKSMSNSIRKLEGQNGTFRRIPLTEQDDRRGSVPSVKQSNVNGMVDVDIRSVRSSSPPASVDTSAPPHPKSYMDIISMVQRGEKPSNIRDINDMPPNPNQQPSNPRLEPKTKPWEVGQPQYSSSQVSQSHFSSEGLTSNIQDNGVTTQTNGNSSTSRWHQKNVRITEIENEEELKTGSYSAANERPIQRTWVPPQPPPVAMAEAAAAIRQPKSTGRKERIADDQSSSHSSDGIDELQRITKISELGGMSEINGGNLGVNTSEIQEEQQEYNNEMS